MNKYCGLLIGLLTFAACSDDKTEPAPEQKVECRITKPADGQTVDLGQPMEISGTGAVENGRIGKVTLRVDGKVVPEVTSVPFDYTYAFDKDQKPGDMKVVLIVESDLGKQATAYVTVQVVRGEDPGPGPGPDPDPVPGPVLGSMTDARDGNTYQTVKLADQVWMAENLRYLPAQHTDISSTEPRYYVMFDHDAKTELGAGFLDAYGAYYNLPAALQGDDALKPGEIRRVRGACPEGWHLPSQAEWQLLAKYVLDAGMAAVMSDGRVDETAIAKALASQTMWIMPPETEIEPQPTWVAEQMDKNNATKFNGLPVGFRACAGEDTWLHSCYSAGWWSSTAATVMDPDFGVPVRMWSDLQTFVTTSEFNPGVGLPLRCVQD